LGGTFPLRVSKDLNKKSQPERAHFAKKHDAAKLQNLKSNGDKEAGLL
jgi:hypothetical protein